MNSIAKSTTQTPIRKVSDAFRAGKEEIMVQNIKERIMEAAVYRGIRMAGEDALKAAISYLEDLKRYFPGLALEEVTEVIRDGVRKEYGEFFGINAGTLYDWTCSYMRSPKREAYVKAVRERLNEGHLLARKNDKSQEEIDSDIIRSIEESFASFRKMIERKESIIETPEGAVAGGVFQKAFPAAFKAMRYPIGHPLFDPGHYRETWLHDHGYTGSLKEIFENAMNDGREYIVRRISQ